MKPDLVVTNISITKDGRLNFVIRNAGTAGLPELAYDKNSGVTIQVYNGGKPWGGIRLSSVDKSKRLKSPGATVNHTWFPSSKTHILNPGAYQIKVVLDTSNVLSELNERNNSKTQKLTYRKPLVAQIPDTSSSKVSGTRTQTPQTTTATVGTTTAQRQQVPAVAGGMTAQLQVPDLVLSNFMVNQNAVVQNANAFNFPFSVQIRNTGTAVVNVPFDLTFETFSDTNNQWGGHNAPGINCKRVSQVINPGQTISFSGTITLLNFSIADQDLRIRAYVDAACSDEFSKTWGHVGESNENNNFSNEVTIGGDFHPYVGSVTPAFCIRGDGETMMIGGTGFGSDQGSHTVALRRGNTRIEANVTDWHGGVVYFTVPSNAEIGMNKVCIADTPSLQCSSTANEVDLDVRDKKILTWTNLIDTWDIFNEAFSININTYDGGCSYNNTSTMRLVSETSINVPNIQFDILSVDYRFTVRDFNTETGGIILTKQGCNASQLKLVANFESSGTELRGCSNAAGPAGWCDGCVADVHINNGKMEVLFDFVANGGNLSFNISTDFSANVSASSGFVDGLMDAFLGDWNQDVRNEINNGVRQGLLSSTNRAYILSEIENVFRLLAGIGNRPITQYEFKNDGIHMTYTEN
ncbi:MAG: hypothetical protein GY906_21715 [bacterium]|nr:hypothetical protein [bacterium]